MKRATGEYLIEVMRALDNLAPLTDEERAKHAQLVHEKKWRDARAKSAQADAFDNQGGTK